MSKRYGVMCTPKPRKPVGRWMTDGDQDGDRWQGTRAQADREAERLRALDKSKTFEVVPIPDED
jgi:hypothetical protein